MNLWLTRRRPGEDDEMYYSRVAGRWLAAMVIALAVATFCRIMSVVTS